MQQHAELIKWNDLTNQVIHSLDAKVDRNTAESMRQFVETLSEDMNKPQP